VLWRNFRRDVNTGGRDLADQALAVTFAVDQRGVDEVQAEFEGALQSSDRFVIGAAEPHLSADAPGAVADLADLDAGPAEYACSHVLVIAEVAPGFTPGAS